jgi:opacity protein-like surface antigen
MSRAGTLLAGAALALLGAAASAAAARWCLSMGGLGPIRAGMTVEQVLPLADWSGLARTQPATGCWYLRYEGGGTNFRLMIIDGKVVRLELRAPSTLRTLGGAHVGMAEADLEKLYGARLDVQPHKYEPDGHTITLRSGAGDSGLRFESVRGKVTAIQAGPWEHLNYVEGCS